MKFFKFVFLSFVVFLACGYSTDTQNVVRIKQHLDFLKSHQLLGAYADHNKGVIEIVTDFSKILKIERSQKELLLKKGYNEKEAEDSSRVGVIHQDFYWIWIRDAVIFPTGDVGTYNRIIWNSELQGAGLVSILPVHEGKIGLILNYRHATRSWEMELPRGMKEEKETIPQACVRLVKEEAGMVLKSQEFLGSVAPDSSVLSSIVPVYLGNVGAREGNYDKIFSKAIISIYFFTKEEIKQGLKNGFLEIMVKDSKWQVPIRDSFLTYALMQAEIKGFL
jgi:ADP-ribose pyrophosphatase